MKKELVITNEYYSLFIEAIKDTGITHVTTKSENDFQYITILEATNSDLVMIGMKMGLNFKLQTT